MLPKIVRSCDDLIPVLRAVFFFFFCHAFVSFFFKGTSECLFIFLKKNFAVSFDIQEVIM